MLTQCLERLGKQISSIDREDIERSYKKHLETKPEYEAAIAALSEFHKGLFDEMNDLRSQVGVAQAKYAAPDVSGIKQKHWAKEAQTYKGKSFIHPQTKEPLTFTGEINQHGHLIANNSMGSPRSVAQKDADRYLAEAPPVETAPAEKSAYETDLERQNQVKAERDAEIAQRQAENERAPFDYGGAKETTRPTATAERPHPKAVSLAESIRRGGGIDPASAGPDSGELRRISNKETGSTGLVRKGGQTLDHAMESAHEAGYFPEWEDVSDRNVSDFIQAVENDATGHEKRWTQVDINHVAEAIDQYYDPRYEQELANLAEMAKDEQVKPLLATIEKQGNATDEQRTALETAFSKYDIDPAGVGAFIDELTANSPSVSGQAEASAETSSVPAESIFGDAYEPEGEVDTSFDPSEFEKTAEISTKESTTVSEPTKPETNVSQNTNRPTLHGVPPQELTPQLTAKVLYAKETGMTPSDIAERYNLTPAQVESVGKLPNVGQGGQTAHKIIQSFVPSKTATPEEFADKVARTNDMMAELGLPVADRITRDNSPQEIKTANDAIRLAVAKEQGFERSSQMAPSDWLNWLDNHADKLEQDTVATILGAIGHQVEHNETKVAPFVSDPRLTKLFEQLDQSYTIERITDLQSVPNKDLRDKIYQLGYEYGLKQTAIQRAYQAAREKFLDTLQDSPIVGSPARESEGDTAESETAPAAAGLGNQKELATAEPIIHDRQADLLNAVPTAEPVGTIAVPSLFKESELPASTRKDSTEIAKQTPAEPINDFGEKIGGARKDVAESGFTMKGGQPQQPAWMKGFHLGETDEGKFRPFKESNRRILWQSKESYDTKEEAITAIKLVTVASKFRTRKVEGGYEIYRKVTDRKFHTIKGGFESDRDAKEYIIKHLDEFVNYKPTFPERPHIEDLQRTGKDYRNGKNVNIEQFAKQFGFTGVEWGNWVPQDERQRLLNMAYDGLRDLADVLDVPPDAISLGGQLSIAFGSRGKGLSQAAAHYERGRAVFNLTRMHGAGSVAHEWFHALDHYFGAQDRGLTLEKNDAGEVKAASERDKDFLSHGHSYKSQVRPELLDAFKELVKTIHKQPKIVEVSLDRYEAEAERAEKRLNGNLDELRRYLVEPYEYARKKNAASTEQTRLIDELIAKIKKGDLGNPVTIETKGSMFRHLATHENLRRLNELAKEIRGRGEVRAESGRIRDIARNISDIAYANKQLEKYRADNKEERHTPTKFSYDAKDLDRMRVGDYWSTEHEMAARAFESYIEDQLKERGDKSQYLVHSTENSIYKLLYGLSPYPEGAERQRIDEAFKKFFNVLQSKQDENGNGILFSQSQQEAQDVADHIAPYTAMTESQLVRATELKPGQRRNAVELGEAGLEFFNRILRYTGNLKEGQFVSGIMLDKDNLAQIQKWLGEVSRIALKQGDIRASARVRGMRRTLARAASDEGNLALTYLTPAIPSTHFGAQEEYGHVGDTEIRESLGIQHYSSYDTSPFESTSGYLDAIHAVRAMGYKEQNLHMEILAKIGRDDAAAHLGISPEQVQALRDTYDQQLADLGATKAQFTKAFGDISDANNERIEQFANRKAGSGQLASASNREASTGELRPDNTDQHPQTGEADDKGIAFAKNTLVRKAFNAVDKALSTDDFASPTRAIEDVVNRGMRQLYDADEDAYEQVLKLAGSQARATVEALKTGHRDPTFLEALQKRNLDDVRVTLEVAGLATPVTKGAPVPATVMGKPAKLMRIGDKPYAVPKWLAGELDNVLSAPKDPNVIQRFVDKLDTYGMKGPLDLFYHGTNVLATVISNTPYAGTDIVSKTIGNTPATKWLTAIVNIWRTNPESVIRDNPKMLEEMAEAGVIPPEYGKATYSSRIAGTGVGGKVKASLAPLLNGPKGLDIRTRILLWKIGKEMNPKATPTEMNEFVNQLGIYDKALQSQLVRGLTTSRVGRFAVAGTTMTKNGVLAWLNKSPMPTEDLPWGTRTFFRAQQQFSAGPIGIAVIMWVGLSLLYRGMFPWQDPKSQFLRIPLNEKDRKSPLVRKIYGDTGDVSVNLGFFNPLLERGARGLGISGAYNTGMLGGSKTQMLESGMTDALNTAIHPVSTSPTSRAAFEAITGNEMSLKGVRDDQGKSSAQFWPLQIPKGSGIGRKALEGGLDLNPFVGAIAHGLGVNRDAKDPNKLTQSEGNVLLQTLVNIGMPRLIKQSDTGKKYGFIQKQKKAMERNSK
jgi:uncharacterized protein YegP (UPF0339 family)